MMKGTTKRTARINIYLDQELLRLFKSISKNTSTPASKLLNNWIAKTEPTKLTSKSNGATVCLFGKKKTTYNFFISDSAHDQLVAICNANQLKQSDVIRQIITTEVRKYLLDPTTSILRTIHTNVFVGGLGLGLYKSKVHTKMERIDHIYDEILQSGCVRAYCDIDVIVDTLPDNLGKFQTAIQNDECEVSDIVVGSERARKTLEDNYIGNKAFDYFYLHKKDKLEYEDFLIYGNKIALINFKKGFRAMVIEDKYLVKTEADMYDYSKKLLKLNQK